MTLTATTLTNADQAFYPLLGPYLARREVHAALGGELWNEDGKTWIVALRDGELVGFLGWRPDKNLVRIESLYVVPAAGPDDLTVRRFLLQGALNAVAPSPVTTTVLRERTEAHLAEGFVVTGETANFLTLTKAGS
jgi:hypothetical protein